jgi:hypothetical protein
MYPAALLLLAPVEFARRAAKAGGSHADAYGPNLRAAFRHLSSEHFD